jgi:opacity protein-like surface antigen
MTRFAVATLTLILIGLSAFAQDSTPKLQVFAGYSLLQADTGKLTGNTVDVDLHQPFNTFGVASNVNGWNAEAQYNFDRWFGIAADFGGRYGTPIIAGSASLSGLPNSAAYSVMAGPVLSYRAKVRITPFVHALFGFDRTSLSASTITGLSSPVSSAAITNNDFALALGGGLDYKLSRHLGIRVGQLDYFHTSVNLNSFYGSAFGVGLFEGLATHQRNLRFSTGIVLKF